MILLRYVRPDLKVTWKQVSDALLEVHLNDVSAMEGRTNTADGRLRSLDPHSHSRNEGEIIYDILYRLVLPGIITFLENIEFERKLGSG